MAMKGYFAFLKAPVLLDPHHQIILCYIQNGYDTKLSDGEDPGMLRLWGIRSTPSLPLLPGSFWPGVVAPDRAIPMG